MRTGLKITSFVAGLVAAFGSAYAVGGALDPVAVPKEPSHRESGDGHGEKSAGGVAPGADLAASGDARPDPLPEAARTVTVDGYEVTLDGALRPGAGSELKLEVEKDGKPVTDLHPHLGAYGHLVALRTGDLAYLRVHPNGEPGDGRTGSGSELSFTTTAPSEGAYRLFLDFRHGGKVRTAAFAVYAGGAASEEHAAEGGGSAGHCH
ncbi:hypothetical protein F2B00_09600 [Streptomyces parvus]|uniref:hypothetical protein n=1 Tax=Streptomyces parvus TaxID=66428 RepID=UPI00123AE757|nr:hypothetical protein [Streptomyces parvus]KAA6202519.1 hypothetical protein F2B00_09600 [Streptomyces parvus]GGS29917.1 hypothetical protein GCM10010221_29680 [Streptomyces parvus]